MIAIWWINFFLKYILFIIVTALSFLSFLTILAVPSMRSSPLFLLIRTLICLDSLMMIVRIIHDLPNDYEMQNLFGEPLPTIYVVLACIRWFSELFTLPFFSVLHFLAIFMPVHFRHFNTIHVVVVLAVIFTVASGFTIPLLTPCCGFKYYVKGSYWAFDYSKPGTPTYVTLNLILQGFCVGIMLLLDVLIVVRIWIRRRTAVASNQVAPTKRNDWMFSRTEARLTFSFLILSASFIIPTIVFNTLIYWEGFVGAGIAVALANTLEYSKFIIYTFCGSAARRGFLRVLRCQCR